MRLGVEAALVDGTVVPGDVLVEDGAIARVGVRPAARSGVAVPGFVDLQVNGFGGVDFLATDDSGFVRAGAALAATGVTSYQPTLVTAPEAVLVDALAVATAAQRCPRQPRILGVHLEGPFLSPAWRGAHDAAAMAAPDASLAERLLAAGPVTYMTVAPELPGGLDLVDLLVRRGVVVAIGHSDADAAAAHRAFERGARAVTHLFNAHRRFAARDPGIAGVALARPDVTVTVIADLVHVAAETLLLTWRAAAGRLALVTDAIAAAPNRSGDATLGGRAVGVVDGVVRLPDGTLAGSTLRLDRAVATLVSLGAAWPDAVAAASTVPARLVGRDDLGTLRPGTPADVAVLDAGHQVVRTVVGGTEAWAG